MKITLIYGYGGITQCQATLGQLHHYHYQYSPKSIFELDFHVKSTMAPVDQNRTSFHSIHDSDHAKRIQRVLDQTNFPRLCSRAVELRKHEEDVPDTLTCSVDTTKFTSGWCDVVIALAFSDTVQWVARIMLSRGRRDEDTSISLLSEISTMELIRSNTTIPVPRVFEYCTRSDIGHPCLIMEALPGNVLENTMALSVPDERKGAFAAQLATYIYELSTLRFSKIGRISHSTELDEPELLPFPIGDFLVGHLSTSPEYFYDLSPSQGPNQSDYRGTQRRTRVD